MILFFFFFFFVLIIIFLSAFFLLLLTYLFSFIFLTCKRQRMEVGKKLKESTVSCQNFSQMIDELYFHGARERFFLLSCLLFRWNFFFSLQRNKKLNGKCDLWEKFMLRIWMLFFKFLKEKANSSQPSSQSFWCIFIIANGKGWNRLENFMLRIFSLFNISFHLSKNNIFWFFDDILFLLIVAFQFDDISLLTKLTLLSSKHNSKQSQTTH